MSRAEMMKQLPTPSELRESVQQVEKTLNETVAELEQVKAQMLDLPQAVAKELAAVTRLSESLDQSLKAQRATLDTMSGDMLQKNAWAMQKITEAVSDLQDATKALRASRQIPRKITELMNQLDKTKGVTLWKLLLMMFGTALVTSALTVVAVGMLDSRRPAQPSVQQHSQATQGDVWGNLKSLLPSR